MTKSQQLKELYAQLEEAVPLPLAQVAQDIVPGEGSPDAELLFIGEAPGEQEAKLRRPFVGRSGQLFRKTLQEVGYSDTEVFISNIAKARPPENRDPLPNEIAAYRPYLDREIEIIEPTLIVTLGRYSMAKFLPEVKISQVHGRLHKVMWNSKVVFILPMYHPAAALRAPIVAASFREDFQKIAPILKWVKDQQENIKLSQDVKSALLWTGFLLSFLSWQLSVLWACIV